MKKITVFLLSIFALHNTVAQENVITTAVPFLLIAADARSAGMGDIGIATSADAFSQQWNPAKYAFAVDKVGVGVSYTPYLTDLVNDISLGQLNYYNRIGERSAFGASLRYFGLGDIELRQEFDDVPFIVSPNELAFDVSYSLQLSPSFSMAVAGRYIRSQLKIPSELGDASPANTFAVDVAGYYQSEELAFDDFNGRFRGGFNFQNMGPKMNYNAETSDLTANFLPANMKLGGGFDFIFDEYNKITINAEVNKLLVPTPQEVTDVNGDGIIDGLDQTIVNDEYNSIGWVSGIFESFSDAPGGMSEELKEFTWALGTEYSYQDSFMFRLGYFHESEDKGARKFFSFGAGFKYNVIKIDVSYLMSASNVKNPLENTLRFSLTFNFGDKYDEY
ncbi:type IX secretion system outer membrane channel protein PorV [Flavobacterium sp.]|uniref:type IX secretion system outer membrane channel protein PorV n=1 Tax=Flavobacterium sp. TaxID=239 RepID=UPI002625D9FE|nr:type IX secretion system outer membrane channel protein PorV [Flavobacterium sp.]MDD2987205.1 type IX secretion system outer membrane channel protein PorV [Flavobacterium sp.]